MVGGQVVLGQEADLERRLRDTGQPRLVGRPRLLVEVPTEPIRDVLVREPLLRDLDVPIEKTPGLRLELDEQRPVGLEGFGVIDRLARLEAAFRVGHLVSWVNSARSYGAYPPHLPQPPRPMRSCTRRLGR